MELPTTGPFLHVPVRFPALFPPLPQTRATAAPETQKGGRILLPPPSLQQLALLLLPDHRETVPKGLHGEVRFAENELVDDFRRKQRQPGRLRHHAGIDADGFRQRLDVGVSPIVDQRLPVESSGKIQQQGRITSQGRQMPEKRLTLAALGDMIGVDESWCSRLLELKKPIEQCEQKELRHMWDSTQDIDYMVAYGAKKWGRKYKGWR